MDGGANAANAVILRMAIRLMCWSHVCRNVRPKLATVRDANKALGEDILKDISIQWICTLVPLLVAHYSNLDLQEKEQKPMMAFFRRKSINQSINSSINPSINQSINKSINLI